MVAKLVPDEQKRIAAIAATCVNIRLRQITRVVSGFYDSLLSATGLHGNQLLLLVVPYLAGPIRINKMADMTGLDRTTLVRNLKSIEDQGWVTIKPGADRRMRMVTLTEKGRETLIAALPLWEQAQKQVLELVGSQHAALMDILNTLGTLENDR